MANGAGKEGHVFQSWCGAWFTGEVGASSAWSEEHERWIALGGRRWYLPVLFGDGLSIRLA